MKLKLFFNKEKYTSLSYGQPVLLGDASALMTMLRNTGIVHSMRAGDRLEDKAVNFIQMMMDQAGVSASDSTAQLTGKLFENYINYAKVLENEVALELNNILRANGADWERVELPDTQKFPMQATFRVYHNHYVCIGFDQLGELGLGEREWVLFLVIDTENCMTRNVIGAFTGDSYRVAYNKFAEFAPALIDWTTPDGNSDATPTASGTWGTYPRIPADEEVEAVEG